MDKDEKISSGQIAYLALGSAAGNIIFTFTFVTFITGKPFWIAAFLGVVSIIPFAIWIFLLGAYKPGGTIFDILEDGIGKFFSKILIIIYLVLNVLLAVCMLVMFTETVKVFFLEYTPSFIIMLFIITMCAVFTNSGIQTFGRLIEALVFLYMANYLVGFSISFAKGFNYKYVTPVFDTTLTNFGMGIFITAAASMECLLCLMVIVSSIPSPQKELASAARGIFSWGVFLSFAILIMEGIESSELLSRVAQAGITVSRIIQIGDFVRGMEILILMTYQYFTVVKTIIFIYSCTVSAKKLFNAKKSKPFLITFSALIFAVSLWMDSFNSGYYYSIYISVFALFPYTILVLILATISVKKIRKRSGSSKQ